MLNFYVTISFIQKKKKIYSPQKVGHPLIIRLIPITLSLNLIKIRFLGAGKNFIKSLKTFFGIQSYFTLQILFKLKTSVTFPYQIQ